MTDKDEDYKESWGPFIDLFRQEVSSRSEEIDRSDSYCWLSLTVGWAVAKGLDPEDAALFAVYIRYKTDLG